MKKGIRQCISCRNYSDSFLMLKITKTNKDLIVLPTNNCFGRSAYICYSFSCVNAAKKSGKLNRSLKISHIENEIWDSIYCELNNRTEIIEKCG